MIFRGSKIDNLITCELQPMKDSRGHFVRTYDGDILRKYDWHKSWIQEGQSLSLKKGTIRGFHIQEPPFTEAKCIRVLKGSVFAAFVDLRHGSKTFGQYQDFTLTEENPTCVLVPRGLACGICTLEDNTILSYKMDNVFNPSMSIGLLWNDPELNVQWPPMDEYIISDKDKCNMSFQEFKEKYKALVV